MTDYQRDFNAFVKTQAAKSFPKLDLKEESIWVPIPGYVKGVNGSFDVKLMLVVENDVVAFYIRLVIVNDEAIGVGSVPYEHELGGLTSLDQPKKQSVFQEMVAGMLDGAAAFIEKMK